MASRRMFPWQAITGSLALLGAVLLATPGSAAATDLGSFKSRIGRSAQDVAAGGSPKATCVCQDGSEFAGMAGLLEHQQAAENFGSNFRETIKITCRVVGFDIAGEQDVSQPCGTFVPLPR